MAREKARRIKSGVDSRNQTNVVHQVVGGGRKAPEEVGVIVVRLHRGAAPSCALLADYKYNLTTPDVKSREIT